MPKFLKKLLLAVGIAAIALPLVLYLVLASGLATEAVNHFVKSSLEGSLAGDVQFGRISTNLFSRLSVEKVRVYSKAGQDKVPVLSMDRLQVEYRLWDFLLRKLRWVQGVEVVRLEGLRLYLIRDEAGHWNLRDLIKPLGQKSKKKTSSSNAAVPLLATRIALDSAEVYLQDRLKNFQSTIKDLWGELDTRALPELSFQLKGRTDESRRDNLSFQGKAWLHQERAETQVDLGDVPLERYINYLLGKGSLHFIAGQADLHLLLDLQGDDVDVHGKTTLKDGVLKVPGVQDPLKQLNGEIEFLEDSLRFKNLSANFLGSQWNAGGEVKNFAHPRLKLFVEDPNLDMAKAGQAVLGDQAAALAIEGNAALGVSITGRVFSPKLEGWARANSIRLKNTQLEGLETNLQFYQGKLLLQNLSGRIWQGDLLGQGSIEFTKAKAPALVAAQLSLKKFSLGDLIQQEVSDSPFSGTGSAVIRVGGNLKSPQINLDFDVPAMNLGNLALGSLTFHSSWRPGNLAFSLKGWQESLQADGEVNLKAKPEWKSCHFLFHQADIHALASAILSSSQDDQGPRGLLNFADLVSRHFSGHLSLDGNLRGRLSQPSVALQIDFPDGEIRTSDGGLAKLAEHETLQLNAHGRLEYEGRKWKLGDKEPFRLAILRRDLGLRVECGGLYQTGSGAADSALHLKIRGDLSMLQAFEVFDKPAGTLQGDVLVTGALDNPSAQGSIEVINFHSHLKKFLRQVSDGHIKIEFKGKDISLQALYLRSGGALQGEGQLHWAPHSFPSGNLSLRTDDQGLFLDNWDEVANGFIVVNPIQLDISDENQGLKLSGAIKAHDMTIYYGGGGRAKAKAKSQAKAYTTPLDLDLSLSLGDNVNYQNGLDEGLPDLNVMDLAYTGSQLLKSTAAFYTKPSFQIRLKPTSQDFKIQGPVNDLRLAGTLEIEGGIMTYQTNDFNFTSGSVQFSGDTGGRPSLKRRGDVRAEAETRVQVSQSTGEPSSYARSVLVKVKVEPLSESRLEELGWQDVFLNYHLLFSSDPPLVEGDDDLNSKAIASLLALGVIDPASEPGLNLLGNQVVRILSHSVQKFLGKGYKSSWLSKFFDLFLFSPHFVDTNNQIGANPYTPYSSLARNNTSQNMQFRDVEINVGKTLSPKLFLNLTDVWFPSDPTLYNNGYGAIDPSNPQYIYPTNGGRLGLQYTLRGSQHLELDFNYKLTDDLQPRPYTAEAGDQVLSGFIGVKGSTSVSAYGDATAEKRRKEAKK